MGSEFDSRLSFEGSNIVEFDDKHVSLMDRGSRTHGCYHYERRCKIRASCCNEIFDCRHCHSDAMNVLEIIDPRDQHDLPHHDIEKVICSQCSTNVFAFESKIYFFGGKLVPERCILSRDVYVYDTSSPADGIKKHVGRMNGDKTSPVVIGPVNDKFYVTSKWLTFPDFEVFDPRFGTSSCPIEQVWSHSPEDSLPFAGGGCIWSSTQSRRQIIL